MCARVLAWTPLRGPKAELSDASDLPRHVRLCACVRAPGADASKRQGLQTLLLMGGAKQVNRPGPPSGGSGGGSGGDEASSHSSSPGRELVLLVGDAAQPKDVSLLAQRWGVTPTQVEWVKDSVSVPWSRQVSGRA